MAFNNKKTAFLFPGQGAQYVGMGMDFVEKNPNLLKPLTEFDRKYNQNLFSIIKEGPEEVLKETKYTQPAILFHSIVTLQSLREIVPIEPDLVAGHSLGEITALVANGVLDFEDAIYLVHRRGEFCTKASEGISFAMVAIIGLEPSVIKDICEEASSAGLVVVANFNSPEQTVISGTESGVNRACELAKARNAKRTRALPVGGPFHSPLIAKAAEWLSLEMEKIDFKDTTIPVISNADAKPHTDPKAIKDILARQITSPVLWIDCVHELVDQGIELFLEFGPKKVLSGLIKKIDRNIEVLSIDTIQDLDMVKERLEKI